jgi:hypothetical protein
VAIAAAIFAAGAFTSLAVEAGEESQMEHPAGMADPTMMEEGMMAMHQDMHAKMGSMGSKLTDLVSEMEAASGEDKTEALAAVVSELVAQRRAMHEMMAQMQPRMMNHMMEHMASGMMQGMMQSMTECPMMKQTTSSEEGVGEGKHSEHHGGD